MVMKREMRRVVGFILIWWTWDCVSRLFWYAVGKKRLMEMMMVMMVMVMMDMRAMDGGRRPVFILLPMISRKMSGCQCLLMFVPRRGLSRAVVDVFLSAIFRLLRYHHNQ